MCKNAMQTIMLVHPDWEYKLWTDDDIESFPWKNKELFLRTENPGAKSDIWRYEIVNLHGGVYLDVDFICLNPLDPLHEEYEFYCSSHTPEQLIANGIFGSVPNHPLLDFIIDNLQEVDCIDPRSDSEVMNKVGPYFFTKHVKHYLENLSLNNRISFKFFSNMKWFFPLSSKQGNILRRLNYKIPEKLLNSWKNQGCYTVHLFTCTWHPDYHVNKTSK